MADALKHRGPDDSGLFEDREIVLGHTRLSILDLSPRGRQPMTRGRLTITYNGEVYNYRELRSELEGKGCRFTTGTDTEAILYAFQEWGEACLSRFNGMFAFAIWDTASRSLFLARDRVGIKPLYYYASDACFVFASECRAILRSGAVRGAIDSDGLAAQVLLRSYYEPDNTRTLVKGVRMLGPGQCAWIHAPSDVRVSTYWTFPQEESEQYRNEPVERLAEEFMELFRKSVRLRLISDAPLGAFLSGGMDSSLINAIAAREHIAGALSSFTISEDVHSGAADSPMAQDLIASRIVATRLGEKINHREVLAGESELTEDLMNELVDMAWLADDPRFLGLYHNYRAVHRGGLKVVLNGQGPDETMGGYIAENPLARLALEGDGAGDAVHRILRRLSIVDAGKMSEDLEALRPELMEAAASLHARQPGSLLRRSHLFLARTLMHRTLVFEDFLSMKFGVECRVPFLDHRLVEFAFQIPFERHIKPDGSMGKILLRIAGKNLLPPEILSRVKQPFPHVQLEPLTRASRKIYLDHRDAILKSETVAQIYRREAVTEDGAGLGLKDYWLMNNLLFWERGLRGC